MYVIEQNKLLDKTSLTFPAVGIKSAVCDEYISQR